MLAVPQHRHQPVTKHVVPENVCTEDLTQRRLRIFTPGQLRLRDGAYSRQLEARPRYRRGILGQDLPDSDGPVDTSGAADASVENDSVELWDTVVAGELSGKSLDGEEVGELDVLGAEMHSAALALGAVVSEMCLEGFKRVGAFLRASGGEDKGELFALWS